MTVSTYEILKDIIENGEFDEEDAIDLIRDYYIEGDITIDERKELLRLV